LNIVRIQRLMDGTRAFKVCQHSSAQLHDLEMTSHRRAEQALAVSERGGRTWWGEQLVAVFSDGRSGPA
jgi:hypothetical protein